MSVESVTNKYESLTNEEMRKKMEELENKIDAQQKQIDAQQEKIEEQNKVIEAYKKETEDYRRELSEDLLGEQGKEKSDNGQVDSDLNVDNVRFYMWGGRERLEKDNVLNVIKSLKDPYKSEIYEFVKNNNVLGLQKYLNGKIDAQEIDVSKLRETLSSRRIWLNGNHILEDGKFGPQTLETIKFLVKESNDNSEDGGNDNSEDGGNDNSEDGGGAGESDEGYEEGGNNEPFSKRRFDALIERTRPILKKLGFGYVTTGGGILTHNPTFDVTAHEGDRYVSKTFNFHDFVDGDTFLVNKLENTLSVGMIKALQEDKMEKEEERNALKFANNIRGKKYSLKDLNLENSDENLSLITLLHEFPNQKIRIDWQSGCTYYGGDKKNFHIELNRKGSNNKKWSVWEVSRDEFKDSKGNYSEDVFKQRLAQRILDIAKEYFQEE